MAAELLDHEGGQIRVVSSQFLGMQRQLLLNERAAANPAVVGEIGDGIPRRIAASGNAFPAFGRSLYRLLSTWIETDESSDCEKEARVDLMPRQRKTEPEAAVKATQALFWEHGYTRLGTRNIEEKTGLTRFMLQTAHGGKRSLFLQVIDDYLDYVDSSFLPDGQVDSFEKLAGWFESRSDPRCLPEFFCHGCLMLNSIVEFNGSDPEFSLRTKRFFTMVRERFGTVLRTAALNSTSRVDFDTDAKVEILLGLMLSMAVVIRASGSVISAQPLGMATSAMIREWQ